MEYTYEDLLELYTNSESDVADLLLQNQALEEEVFALSEEIVTLNEYIAGLHKDLQHYYSMIND